MARRDPQELQGYRPYGVRRMDHLEAGVCAVPQRVPRAGGAGMHDSVRARRNNLHPVRAWLILVIIALSAGGTAAALFLQWRYG